MRVPAPRPVRLDSSSEKGIEKNKVPTYFYIANSVTSFTFFFCTIVPKTGIGRHSGGWWCVVRLDWHFFYVTPPSSTTLLAY